MIDGVTSIAVAGVGPALCFLAFVQMWSCQSVAWVDFVERTELFAAWPATQQHPASLLMSFLCENVPDP